jgi:peptidoglycan/xylan/chitin deacetylase (PgdA/CDA1 family)
MNLPRFDRLLTVQVVDRLPRFLRSKRPALPILMYHSICDDPEPGRSPYYKTNTSPAAFANQMHLLAKLGYRGLDLESALRAFHRNPAERVAGITFDDGYRDFHTRAFPVLQRYGFQASVFLPTEFIGKERKIFKERECLTWDETRELRRKGIAFGPHTVSHPQLHDVPWDQVKHEISESKIVLERELDEPTRTFAYPYAYPEADPAFVGRLTEEFRRAGIEWCVTTKIGRTVSEDPPLALPRLPVNSCDDETLFTAKLNGSYDWLGAIQRASKRLRSRTIHRRSAKQMCSPASGLARHCGTLDT